MGDCATDHLCPGGCWGYKPKLLPHFMNTSAGLCEGNTTLPHEQEWRPPLGVENGLHHINIRQKFLDVAEVNSEFCRP